MDPWCGRAIDSWGSRCPRDLDIVATSAPAFFAMAMKDQTAMGVRIWCSAKSYLSEKYGLGLALPPRSVMISGICIAAFWIRLDKDLHCCILGCMVARRSCISLMCPQHTIPSSLIPCTSCDPSIAYVLFPIQVCYWLLFFQLIF